MGYSIQKTGSPLDQVSRRQSAPAQFRARRLSEADQAELKQLLAEPPHCVDNEMFHQKDAQQQVFEQAGELPMPNISWYHPVLEDLNRLNKAKKLVNVVLNAEQERALFLQFNYARLRTRQLVDAYGETTLSDDIAQQMLYWYRLSKKLRDRIAQFNLALVLAMAKRVRAVDVDFPDLISEGNMALLRAIDKFDAARGFKFSTYACRAILKAFSRIGIKSTQYRTMFPTDFDPALEKSDHAERRSDEHQDDCASEVRRIVETNRAHLTAMERDIIRHRFALEQPRETAEPLTLEQVGRLVGLTKERVRQIQNTALSKIRKTLEDQYLDGHDRRRALRKHFRLAS